VIFEHAMKPPLAVGVTVSSDHLAGLGVVGQSRRVRLALLHRLHQLSDIGLPAGADVRRRRAAAKRCSSPVALATTSIGKQS
jgi:hypothetical protein